MRYLSPTLWSVVAVEEPSVADVVSRFDAWHKLDLSSMSVVTVIMIIMEGQGVGGHVGDESSTSLCFFISRWSQMLLTQRDFFEVL